MIESVQSLVRNILHPKQARHHRQLEQELVQLANPKNDSEREKLFSLLRGEVCNIVERIESLEYNEPKDVKHQLRDCMCCATDVEVLIRKIVRATKDQDVKVGLEKQMNRLRVCVYPEIQRVKKLLVPNVDDA
ncbi:hypothetical protein JX265_013551 [Neoarthrinium moseri]|uniref:Uncharacterized protein n=1 Tax=Neoarthrinium moseri TaxID=1658444 RepID=A0A9P9W896_9PEZI|nr:uncharacterized protein JN550_005201 [Neoarthrinium moseri]KAI1847268.1 hypothetical protein JX266_006808 [Neoarthrinium moseri]KAI1849848.1 hypothetical protein JX265_013551 [Neoarthrinium moseri]KAI1870658.1 hypothetical protein JN550_005201 [Neoarthrinium moseri]